jgi:hypothetical protein
VNHPQELWRVFAKARARLEEVFYDRPEEGVHFGALDVDLSGRERKQVLRAVNQARLLAYLKANPLKSLEIKADDDVSYGWRTPSGEVVVNTKRARTSIRKVMPWSMKDRKHFESTLNAKQLATSYSEAAPDLVTAFKRTLIHELGHHVYFTMPEEFRDETAAVHNGPRRFVTFRASRNPEEYWAECFATYVFDQTALQKYDPGGYNLIKRVRKRLEIEP